MAHDSKDVSMKTYYGFEARWKLNKVSSMKNLSYRTPVFAPISWIDAVFFFDVHFSRTFYNTFLSVKLNKMFSDQISKSFEFDYQVSMIYSNGTTFKNFESSSNLSLTDWSSENCFDVVSPLYENGRTNSHHYEMISDVLILKCSMKFYPLSETDSQIIRSLNNTSKYLEGFKTLYSTRSFSDVLIRCGEKTLSAHKCVLAAHSPVFKRMLEQDFLETKTGTVVISDFDPEVIENSLKFLYSSDIEDKSFQNVRQLYIFADKYDVQILKQECVKIITESFLTVEYICGVLVMTSEFRDNDLRRNALVYGAGHIQEIATSAEWKELMTSFPQLGCEILSSVFLSQDFSYPEKKTKKTDASNNS